MQPAHFNALLTIFADPFQTIRRVDLQAKPPKPDRRRPRPIPYDLWLADRYKES